MIPVSEAFKTAIYGSARKTYGKVIFQIIDTTALADATASVTSEATISKKDQMFNAILDMTAKYASFESNYWLLDGSFALPPKSSETGYEVGWWSNEISQADKTFAVAQVVTIDFDSDHSSIGLTIFFDKNTNEYAEDFTIVAKDSGGVTIHTETVTGNDTAKYVLVENLSNYRQIIITITKWCNAYRRARITEMAFGVVYEYEGDELISLNVVEDLDTISSQVVSNEMRFTIENQDKRFNILNPTGIYPYLQRKQKITPYLGVELATGVPEYVKMGDFYLTEWKSDEGALTATFTARDILDILSQSYYRKGLYQTENLHDLVVDVLTDASVSDYTIDAALSAITCSGYVGLLTHKQALQTIAIAARAVVYCDRDGKVTIEQLSDTTLSETIDYDNVYKSPKIQLEKLINTVDVAVKNYASKTVSETIYEGSLNISSTSSIWIEYKSAPAHTISSSISGATTVTSETYYSNAGLITLNANGTVTITTSGTVYDISDSIYRLEDPNMLEDEQTLAVRVDNTLVSSNEIAQNIANWVLAEYQKRNLYEINWRGNPALETGDIVTIEDDFSVDKTARLTKHDLSFTGYLACRTNAKGGGD